LKNVGIFCHPKLARAKGFCEELSRVLGSLGVSVWVCSALNAEEARGRLEGTELVFSVGGDGTVLRVARATVPWPIPILGINLGRLGFMTELSPEQALQKLPALLTGEGWIEERSMLQAELPSSEAPFHALNDVVVVRGAIPRVIYVETAIDGESLTTYRADGVIVATATGSTGYCLAAGGPILHPQSKEILLKAISPHLTLDYALVLPSTATVELRVHTDHQAMLSIDGQANLPLRDGEVVRVSRSPHVARFLRVGSPAAFYSTLNQRLSQIKIGDLESVDVR